MEKNKPDYSKVTGLGFIAELDDRYKSASWSDDSDKLAEALDEFARLKSQSQNERLLSALKETVNKYGLFMNPSDEEHYQQLINSLEKQPS